jgi:hypothetical protein
MAFLIEKFSRPGTPVLQIAGEEVYFPLKMGNNWGKIRIGVMVTFGKLYVTQATFPLKIGASVCKGNKGFFHPSPVICFATSIGAHPCYILSASGTPTAGRFWTGTTMWKKNALSTSNVTAGASTAYSLSDWETPGHQVISALYFDFDRVTTASTMTATFYAPVSDVNARVNIPTATFISNVQGGSTPSSTSSIGAPTISMTTAESDLDTITLFCSETTGPVMNVYGICVARLI